MTGDTTLIIEPLAKHHDRQSFQCGIESLDIYLKRQAGQDNKRRISRVFVAHGANNPARIIGYYTLISLSIDLSSLPGYYAKKLPKHPIPAALIGRLAVDRKFQSKGIGGLLLADAIKRTLSVSEEIAIYTLVVDAIDDAAKAFYLRYGFDVLSTRSKRLFLPLKTALVLNPRRS